MRHEEYLAMLIRIFTGDPQEPTQPTYSGSNEADAVARWLAYNIAMHAMEDCHFIPSAEGRVALILNMRTWDQWANSGKEDVDLTLFGQIRLNQKMINSSHQLKVTVSPGRAENQYFLRLSDWKTNRHTDVVGNRAVQSNGRVLIEDHGNPMRWANQVSRRTTATNRAPLEPCCINTMRAIEHITGYFQTYTRAARVFQNMDDILSAVPDITDSSSSNIGSIRTQLNVIQRAEINGLITHEISHHSNNGPLNTHWELMRTAHSSH